MYRIISKLVICLALVNVANASKLPDEGYERKHALTTISDDGLPTRLDIKAVLKTMGITEAIEEATIEGAAGIILFTPSCAIKIPKYNAMGALAGGTLRVGAEEAKNLRMVKAWTKTKKPFGLDLCVPKVFVELTLNPQNMLVFNGYQPVDQLVYHINIADRVQAAGDFCQTMMDFLSYGSDNDRAVIKGFAYRLGQMQANYLNQGGGQFRTCLHGDMNPKNIIMTKRPAPNDNGKYTLIDNGHFRRGTDKNPGHLVSDMVYFTHVTFCWKIKEAGQWVQPSHAVCGHMEEMIYTFYHSYLSAVSAEMRGSLRDTFAARTHLTESEEDIRRNGIYIVEANRKQWFYDILNPIEERATRRAFQAHALPIQIAAAPNINNNNNNNNNNVPAVPAPQAHQPVPVWQPQWQPPALQQFQQPAPNWNQAQQDLLQQAQQMFNQMMNGRNNGAKKNNHRGW